MNIKINGKEYPLHFGIDFLDYIDRIYYFENSGVRVGNGIPMVVVNIEMKNPVVLLHLIKAATITEKTCPSTEDIKKYLETEADYEALYSDFLSALEKAYVTAPQMKMLEKTQKAKKK